MYNIDLKDDFFSTIRLDYKGFDEWFIKKAQKNEMAYITKSKENKITSFLMLKIEEENEDYSFFEKPFNPGKRMKICTFKVSDVGKKIGESFIKIILNEAKLKEVDEIYTTIFKKQKSLIKLLEKYGFELHTYKNTTMNNNMVEKELIYVKKVNK